MLFELRLAVYDILKVSVQRFALLAGVDSAWGQKNSKMASHYHSPLLILPVSTSVFMTIFTVARRGQNQNGTSREGLSRFDG
jgi:hypothetical protein